MVASGTVFNRASRRVRMTKQPVVQSTVDQLSWMTPLAKGPTSSSTGLGTRSKLVKRL